MRAEDLLQKAYSDLVVAAQNLLTIPGEPFLREAIETLRKPLADVLRAKGQGKAANNLERGVVYINREDGTVSNQPSPFKPRTLAEELDPKIAAGEKRLATVEAARAMGAGSDNPLLILTPEERELIEARRDEAARLAAARGGA